MKLIVLVLLSTLTSCASLEIKQQSSYNQDHLVTLPRKLRLIEGASTLHMRVLNSDKDELSYHHQSGSLSGKHYKEAGFEHAKAVTWRQHLERADKFQSFFPMDYTHVRRRRPVHNKSITSFDP